MKIYTKESLIAQLKEIAEKGWIKNVRHGNAGGIGNTLENLLGITENNCNYSAPTGAKTIFD